MGYLRNWRRRRLIRRAGAAAEWAAAVAALPVLHGLAADERRRLQELATVFMHEKVFEPARGARLSTAMQRSIALQACLPILNLGMDWLDDWTAVIVYPDEFVPRREEVDETGVVHICAEPLSGESWTQGPIILSWRDVRAAGHGRGDNVVIHEIAHKLDMRNGVANGFPPLPADMRAERWSEAFGAAFAELRRRIETSRSTVINSYAARSPAECFAVFSEYFFEQPHLVTQTFPTVYEELTLFYRQDPAQRLPAALHP